MRDRFEAFKEFCRAMDCREFGQAMNMLKVLKNILVKSALK